MSEKDLKATLKGGTGFDDPWITVDANDPLELKTKLDGLAAAGVLQAVVDTANLFKGANHAGVLTTPQQPQQSDPWATPAQPQQQQPSRFSGEQHPTGKPCHCGKVLEKKKTSTGKYKWQCPDWRWNNGNPNNHDNEWIN